MIETPNAGLPAIPPVAPAPFIAPSPVTPSRDPNRPPRRRGSRWAAAMLAMVLVAGVAASVVRLRTPAAPRAPLAMAPVVVNATLRLDGALVRGAARDWMVRRLAAGRPAPLEYGVPVPVSLTAYCLRGLTRRDHYVREGIIASDPRLFPLGRYLEVYVGRTYYGRFLIDDTGGAIKGNKLDIWTPTCAEARRFGRVKGTAVLVPAPRGADRDTVTTGRLGGRQLSALGSRKAALGFRKAALGFRLSADARTESREPTADSR